MTALAAANVVCIIANLCVIAANFRVRAKLKRQLRALRFAATEPHQRREGPS